MSLTQVIIINNLLLLTDVITMLVLTIIFSKIIIKKVVRYNKYANYLKKYSNSVTKY